MIKHRRRRQIFLTHSKLSDHASARRESPIWGFPAGVLCGKVKAVYIRILAKPAAQCPVTDSGDRKMKELS